MGKIFTKLKNWYDVTRPSKVILFLQFLTSVIPSALTVLQAIPAANAINYLTTANYKGAMLNLLLAFLCEALAQLSWEFEYQLDSRQLLGIYPKIQRRLFDKIFSADDANFKYTSKEKMVNIITSNIVTLSDFCDYLAYKSAYLVEAIVTLVIIFSTNWIIGLMIFSVAILVYVLIATLNSAIGKQSMRIQDERDNLTESFTDLVDGRILSTDLNLKDQLEEKYLNKVTSLMKHYKKRKTLKSLRDNWVYALYTGIIMVASVYLVHLVSTETLTTTIYLIITPYLTSAITKFVDFFGIFSNLEDANIASLRVKTIFDMNEKDLVEFGNNSTDKIEGAITFSNVKFSSKEKLDKSLGNINNFSAQIGKNQIVLFEGLRNCGKRAIFYMLRRAVRPDEGTITFDTINIYDFDKESYKHNFCYTTHKPYFFNDSIMENLKVVEQNKKKIFDACKTVGIYDTINSLPDGFNTNLTKNPSALNDQAKFLLSLARAMLTKAEITIIYEFPIGLSEKEQKVIADVLNKLKSTRTILVFCATNPIEDIIDKHYKIDKGDITEVELKHRPKKMRMPDIVPENSSPSVHYHGKQY